MANNGPIVFTATPEMAKQIKVLKSGVTYVAQPAVAVNIGDAPTSTPRRSTKKRSTAKRTAAKATKKKSTKKRSTAKKTATKRSSGKASSKKSTKKKVVKATPRKAVQPDIIIQYVRDHAGCNMTDIEAATKMPQGQIRRVLNNARDSGAIRTEGQRRGLRYFASDAEPVAAGTSASSDVDDSHRW